MKFRASLDLPKLCESPIRIGVNLYVHCKYSMEGAQAIRSGVWRYRSETQKAPVIANEGFALLVARGGIEPG